MAHSRRNFLKLAGAAGLGAAAASRASLAAAQAKRSSNGARELPRKMAFCTLRRDGRYVLGVRTERGVLDVEKASRALRKPAPATMDELLQNGDGREMKALVDAAMANGTAKAAFVPEDRAPFGPCVTNPEKILMVGHNYKKHIEEVKAQVPTSPVFFNKFNNALNYHGGTINLPQKVAKKFDYEVELVIVMGKVARDVSEEDALSYVFGYATGNDFTARDLQSKTSQFLLGKTCDGFGPLGPWLVTADQVDPQNLPLECRVNGEVRQNSNTSDMLFPCKTLVSYASQHMTLKPGDIMFTGTPQGVIAGYPPEKQVWLKPGDQISTRVGNLGELRFTLSPYTS